MDVVVAAAAGCSSSSSRMVLDEFEVETFDYF